MNSSSSVERPTSADPARTGSAGTVGLSVGALVALVVGSMIGGGIFALPSQMAASAAPGPLVIGWIITGAGMLMLAMVFQSLAVRRPDVDGGVYGYARAAFGPYVGSASAWGYWISAWIGNVGYLVLLFSTLGYFFPVFGEGTTPAAVLGASVLLWATTLLCIKGVQEAAFVNTIVTIAKIVPLVVFIGVAIIAFKADLFTADIWGTSTKIATDAGDVPLGSVFEQVKAMMLVTVWVFIGIEGASIFSARARKRSDVGKATVIGFVGVLVLLVAINLLAYGLMAQAQMAGLSDPSLAGLLEHTVGRWGGAFISISLIVSLLGALLSWTLLCAEILRLPAREGVLPASLGQDNKNGAPTWALVLTGVCIQLMLVWAWFGGSTYTTLIKLASSLILVPYLLSAMYQLMLTVRSKDRTEGRGRDLFVGVVATVYAVWLLYAAGPEYLLLTALFYAPGTLLYMWARRQRGERMFSPAELALVAVICIAAVVALYLLVSGAITL